MIELFFDRFGGLIMILLFVLLVGSDIGFYIYASGLSSRITKLEGCCEEVQQRLESQSSVDEASLKAYIDETLKNEEVRQSEQTAAMIEEKTAALKEEIKVSVSEEIKAASESSKASEKSSSKKKSKKSSTKTESTSAYTQITTTQTTQTTAEAAPRTVEDPDDKHFKVGSGDEEEE